MAVIMVVQLHQQNNTRAKMVTQTLKQSFFQHIFTAIKVLSGGEGLRHIEFRNIFIVIIKSPLFFLFFSSTWWSLSSWSSSSPGKSSMISHWCLPSPSEAQISPVPYRRRSYRRMGSPDIIIMIIMMIMRMTIVTVMTIIMVMKRIMMIIERRVTRWTMSKGLPWWLWWRWSRCLWWWWWLRTLSMTWTMSNGQTKKMQLSLVVSGETFKRSLWSHWLATRLFGVMIYC